MNDYKSALECLLTYFKHAEAETKGLPNFLSNGKASKLQFN